LCAACPNSHANGYICFTSTNSFTRVHPTAYHDCDTNTARNFDRTTYPHTHRDSQTITHPNANAHAIGYTDSRAQRCVNARSPRYAIAH
jgi:hypothetical protein